MQLCCALVQAARLWVHEVERVMRDRLVSEADMSRFDELRLAVTKKHLGELPADQLEARPLLFTSFTSQARGRLLLLLGGMCRVATGGLLDACAGCRRPVACDKSKRVQRGSPAAAACCVHGPPLACRSAATTRPCTRLRPSTWR